MSLLSVPEIVGLNHFSQRILVSLDAFQHQALSPATGSISIAAGWFDSKVSYFQDRLSRARVCEQNVSIKRPNNLLVSCTSSSAFLNGVPSFAAAGESFD